MRVLHVDTGREWRGGQTQLLHLARAWTGEVGVAVSPDAPLVPALREAGVRIFPIRGRGLAGRLALRRAVRGWAPDLVCAQTSHAHGLALGCGAPVVVHRRLDFRPHRVSWPKYRLATGYVAVSRAVAEVLVGAGVHPRRIAVVHDGVDPAPLDRAVPDPVAVRRELGWPADAVVLLAAGALVPHKGHRYLVEAAARCRADVRVALCGQGPLMGPLRRQIRRLGVEDRIRLLGHRADLPRLLRSVDGFVHPSVEEGMGQVVAEARIAGLPVVASRAGGLPEVVGDGGHLVPARDPRALAQALDELVWDLAERTREARAGAQEARARHGVGQMVERTAEAYRRLLDAVGR